MIVHGFSDGMSYTIKTSVTALNVFLCITFFARSQWCATFLDFIGILMKKNTPTQCTWKGRTAGCNENAFNITMY